MAKGLGMNIVFYREKKTNEIVYSKFSAKMC